MTNMPELIYLYDRGVPRGMQVVYGGTRIVGDTEYTRSDTIQALRESHDRLLAALKSVPAVYDDMDDWGKWHKKRYELIFAAEKLQEGR